MGLLDNLAGQVLGNLADNLGNRTGDGLAGILGDLLGNPQSALGNIGGLNGLIEAFQQNGLGDIIQSWIGTGENLPINADQLQNILGGDTLQNLATQLGLNPADAGGQLADLLPNLIDQLTPNGQLPDGNGLDGLLGGLKNLLG